MPTRLGLVPLSLPAAPLMERTVTGNYVAVADDDIIYADATANPFTINVTNLDPRTRPLVIKRIDFVETNRVVIRDDANGIDGSHGNDITLNVTTTGGVQSGESATLLWDTDASTWRLY